MAKKIGCTNGILYKKENKYWITVEGAKGVLGPWGTKKAAIDTAVSAGFCKIEDNKTGAILFKS